jgi:hypothetical protein
MVGVAAPTPVGASVEQRVALMPVAEADLGTGSTNNVGERCCVRNRYTRRRTVKEDLSCDC